MLDTPAVSKKTIYIYSPSSAVRDTASFNRGVRRLKSLGYDVEIDPDARRSHMRFAGSDDTRVRAIGRAAASGADVALISRGGYGLTRMLPLLPYDAMARSIEQGMLWVGLSDFTALQMGLMAHQQRNAGSHSSGTVSSAFGQGAVTWAGPALGEDFGADPKLGDPDNPLPDDIMEACFDDLMCGQGEGAGWQLPRAERSEMTIEGATLWGGNLSVLVSLVGTPFLPDVTDGILFLEDVNEHPFRIERMLTHLLHAGVLAKQRAVLLGQFNRYKLAAGHDRGFGMPTVVSWLRTQLQAGAPFSRADGEGVPVLTGLPFGHVATKVLLPVGQRVELAVSGRDALLYWD
jgi:muramoyltetrapeptide carboxypeptidase